MKALTLLKELILFHKLRIGLLVLATTLAFLTYGVLGSFRYSFDSGDTSVSESRLIVTHQNGLMQSLPLAYFEQIQQIPGVDTVGHATWQGLYFQSQRNMPMILAVSASQWFEQHPDMVIDTQSRKNFLAHKDGMLVTQALANKYQWQAGDIVPFNSFIFTPPNNDAAWNYRIAGTFVSADSGGGRNYAISHYDYFNQGRNVWNDTVGTFVVTAKDPRSIMELAQRIDGHFLNSNYPTSTNTDREFHAEFFAQFGNVVQLITMVTFVVFAALVLIVASSMALTIRQLSRPLGILRVIGYSNKIIYSLILTLVAIIVALGVVIGLGLAALFNHVLTSQLPQFLPDILLPLPVIAEVSMIAVTVTGFVTLIPIWITLRTKVADTLAIEQSIS
jgi:putative ABC transport system permease protein